MRYKKVARMVAIAVSVPAGSKRARSASASAGDKPCFNHVR